MVKLCVCEHGAEQHTNGVGACEAEDGDREPRCCPCPAFMSDPRSLSLTDHLEAVSLALGGALEELNTYQGIDRKTGMPVWSSGDDFRAHGDLIEILNTIERLRGRLRLGLWIGRTAS